MSILRKIDKQTSNELRSILSKLNMSKSKVTIDLEYNTIEVIEDYAIDDILESAGALTPERAKEMEAEVRKMREEWNG